MELNEKENGAACPRDTMKKVDSIFTKIKEGDYFIYYYKGEAVGMYLPEISAGGYLHEGRTWMIQDELMNEEEFIRFLEKENSK